MRRIDFRLNHNGMKIALEVNGHEKKPLELHGDCSHFNSYFNFHIAFSPVFFYNIRISTAYSFSREGERSR